MGGGDWRSARRASTRCRPRVQGARPATTRPPATQWFVISDLRPREHERGRRAACLPALACLRRTAGWRRAVARLPRQPGSRQPATTDSGRAMPISSPALTERDAAARHPALVSVARKGDDDMGFLSLAGPGIRPLRPRRRRAPGGRPRRSVPRHRSRRLSRGRDHPRHGAGAGWQGPGDFAGLPDHRNPAPGPTGWNIAAMSPNGGPGGRACAGACRWAGRCRAAPGNSRCIPIPKAPAAEPRATLLGGGFPARADRFRHGPARWRDLRLSDSTAALTVSARYLLWRAGQPICRSMGDVQLRAGQGARRPSQATVSAAMMTPFDPRI